MVLRETLRVVDNQLTALMHLPRKLGTKLSSNKIKRNYIAGTLSVIAAALGLFGWQVLSAVGGNHAAVSVPQNLNGNLNAAESAAGDNAQSASNSSNSTSVSTNSDSNNNFSADVKVNGRDIPLPNNGSVHKTITSDGVTTNVDVSVNNNGSTSNRSTQRVRLNTHSTTSISSSTSETNTSSGGN